MAKRALIEAIVVSAVADVMSGRSVEDERIECKGKLPGPDKARQLAGAANSAMGEEIIWIIGLNEDSRAIQPLDTSLDLADWWAQMVSRFNDAVVPEMTSTYVETGYGRVLGLHFETDRSPYLVKTTGGNSELEVPWREGTRTRSAKRHELLRLLLPTVGLPTITILDANLSYFRSGRASLTGNVDLFFEHLGPDLAFLPIHQASIAVLGENRQVHAITEVNLPYKSRELKGSRGIEFRHDGIYCTGPGRLHLDFDSRELNCPPEFEQFDELALNIEFAVVGHGKKASARTTLARTDVTWEGPEVTAEFTMSS
ncbi:hypothetical protein K7640_18020 [Micromonospora sp. PLK6-60]|uniref:hypothetical protein n=1 Tax=Micromonospora sp. PLK6-60 TaxID=2873383 RepID=UPI001CA7B49A|nr:hypothetical protein [Micromonospora sp. PLK6-60]MBY8873730.1 hypothetical protein [Micromonospora sp. PLK6-60]